MTEENKKDTHTGLSPEEINKINKDLEEAKANLISDEVQQKINEEKEKARVEFEKEALVNEELKNKQLEIEGLKKKMEEDQRRTAELIAKFEGKLDELTSSKAPISMQNPFTQPPQDKPLTNNFNTMTEEQVNEIERLSRDRFLKNVTNTSD